MILLCESDVTALLFYGVFRLIPELRFRECCSFSTFESDPEKVACKLSSVPVLRGADSADASETYSRSGCVIDTYSGVIADTRNAISRYAPYVFRRLLDLGWPEVDELRSSIPRSKRSCLKDWEYSLQLHDVVDAVFNPEQSAQPQLDHHSEENVAYLRLQFIRHLEQYR